MMAPEPKEKGSGEVLDQELEKPVAKGIRDKNQEPELQSMVLRAGQMPIYRRLPKRGFKNPFRKQYAVVNLGDVQKAIEDGRLEKGTELDEKILREAGLAGKKNLKIRLLAKGDFQIENYDEGGRSIQISVGCRRESRWGSHSRTDY
jgi:large subunit ribosomal protein L15